MVNQIAVLAQFDLSERCQIPVKLAQRSLEAFLFIQNLFDTKKKLMNGFQGVQEQSCSLYPGGPVRKALWKDVTV